jgi:hypothetical protein
VLRIGSETHGAMGIEATAEVKDGGQCPLISIDGEAPCCTVLPQLQNVGIHQLDKGHRLIASRNNICHTTTLTLTTPTTLPQKQKDKYKNRKNS